MFILMGSSLAVFWNSFPLLQSKNEILTFIREGFSGVTFIKLKCMCLQTGLPDFKNHQTIAILLKVDFYAFVLACELWVKRVGTFGVVLYRTQ